MLDRPGTAGSVWIQSHPYRGVPISFRQLANSSELCYGNGMGTPKTYAGDAGECAYDYAGRLCPFSERLHPQLSHDFIARPVQPQTLAQGAEASEGCVEASGPESDAIDGAVRRVTDRIGELTVAAPASSPEVRLIRALLEEVYRRA